MVVAVEEEEETAPPVAGEQWGRARRKEKGVGKGGTVHLRRDVHPSEPTASFLGKRKAERGHHFYPCSLKPTIHVVFHGRSDCHLGGLSALENVLQPVL